MHPLDHRRDLPATRHDQPQPIDDAAYMEQVWAALRAEQAHLPATATVHQAVPLPADDVRVVGYREHAGVLIPVYEQRTLHPQPIRDLSPQPLLDVTAQRLLGGGIGGGALAAGVGWGIGQAANGLAGLGSGALVWIALMFLATKLPTPAKRRGGSDASAGTTVNIRRAVFKKNHFQG